MFVKFYELSDALFEKIVVLDVETHPALLDQGWGVVVVAQEDVVD